jgi:hypothetical protein
VGAATSGLGDEVSDFARKLGSGFGSAWAQNQVMATDPDYTRSKASSMFISALGSAIGDTITEPSQRTSAMPNVNLGSFGWDDSMQDTGPLGLPPTVEAVDEQPSMSFDDLRRSEDAGTSVSGHGYVAREGDSISRILGTSNPQAIGNFMRANGLNSSTLHAGQNYFVPDDSQSYGDAQGLGQQALSTDNQRLALVAQQREAQQQAYWDSLQADAWSGRTGSGGPVWHTAGTSTAADASIEVPQYDAMGNYTGTTTVIAASSGPEMSYVDQMSHVADALRVPQGFMKNSYDQAVAGMLDENNSWSQRGVNGLLATAMMPLAVGEEFVRGVLNVPSSIAEAVPLASNAGTEFAMAMDASLQGDQRVGAGLAATRDFSAALVNLLGAAVAAKPGFEISPEAFGNTVGDAAAAEGDIARGIARNQVGANGSTTFADLSSGAKRLVTQFDPALDLEPGTFNLDLQRAKIGNGVQLDDLRAASEFNGREMAVVRDANGNLVAVQGDVNGIRNGHLLPGDDFLIHTHPVYESEPGHFTLDIRNASKATEAVIDWGGNVTYFNKYGIIDAPTPAQVGEVMNPFGYIGGH